MFLQRMDHHGGLGRITLPQHGDVFGVDAGLDAARDDLLEEVRRPEVVVALEAQADGLERLGHQAEAHADAGREGFAVGARVDDALGGAGFREQRRHVVAFKAQLAIGRVFQQVDRMAGGAFVAAQQLERGGLLGPAGRDGAGVLVVADEVEELQLLDLAGLLQPLQLRLQRIEVEAVRIKLHAAAIDGAALGDAEKDEVGRVFHEHDVALVAERFAGEIKELLRTVRQDHPFRRVGGDIQRGGGNRAAVSGRVAARLGPPGHGGLVLLQEAEAGEFAQDRIALGGAVLQGGLAALRIAEDVGEERKRLGVRQRFLVGEPGGEGDELRTRQGEDHQPRDRRRIGTATQGGQGGLAAATHDRRTLAEPPPASKAFRPAISDKGYSATRARKYWPELEAAFVSTIVFVRDELVTVESRFQWTRFVDASTA